jgi:hypothetical protein
MTPSTAGYAALSRSRTRQWRDNCYREFLPLFLAPDPAGDAR